MIALISLLNIGSLEFFYNKIFNQLTFQFVMLVMGIVVIVALNSYKILIDKIIIFGVAYIVVGVGSFFWGGQDLYLFGLILFGLINGILIYFGLLQYSMRINIKNLFHALRVTFYIGSIFGLLAEILARFGIYLPISWGYGLCMPLFPLVVYSLHKKKINILKVGLSISPFLLLIFITSWRAFAVMSIIGIYYSFSRYLSVFRKLMLVLIAAIVSASVLLASSKSSQADLSSGRVFLWIKTANIIEDNNFNGSGFGQFSSYYYDAIRYDSKTDVGEVVFEAPGQSKDRMHTHNIILQVLFDAGLLGLILLFSIMIYTYKNVNNLKINTHLRRSLKISLISMLVTSLASSFGGIYSMSFWMISGVLMSVVRLELNNCKNNEIFE